MSPKNGRMRVTSATRSGFCNQWIGPIVILTVTLLSFGPILRNQFVDWDDYENLISNTHYRGLGWPQLSWMFTTFHMGPYQPLSWVTLGLDYLIWGTNPTGYHLTSLLFHAANAVFFYSSAAASLASFGQTSRLMRHRTSAPLRRSPLCSFQFIPCVRSP